MTQQKNDDWHIRLNKARNKQCSAQASETMTLRKQCLKNDAKQTREAKEAPENDTKVNDAQKQFQDNC